MKVADLAKVLLVTDDEGQPQGVEVVFEEGLVASPLAAAEALDRMRAALQNSAWVANTVLRVKPAEAQSGAGEEGGASEED